MNFKLKLYSSICFGTGYGIGRSFYWLSKTNDESYIKKDNDIIKVKHPHTFVNKTLYTLVSAGMSQFLWPFFILSDLNYYEKNKLGIRDITPPFPFDKLKWKE